MAKSVILNRELERRQKYASAYLQKQVHQAFLKDSRLLVAERQNIYQKRSLFPYSISLVRLKNYCMLTGHSRSIYRDVKLSRHKFNQMALNGEIPGCSKALGNFS